MPTHTSYMPAERVLSLLEPHYPAYDTVLTYDTPWQLLISIILSAQCTDDQVNRATPALFKALPTPQAMVKAPLPKIEKLIFSTGFYKNKAKNIQAAARAILRDHDWIIPNSMERLVTIPGVGRKTANVYLHIVHRKTEGVVVDTHIFRVSKRTGVSKGNTPEQVERDVMEQLPKAQWKRYGDVLIQHGRKVCHARKPACGECVLREECPKLFVE